MCLQKNKNSISTKRASRCTYSNYMNNTIYYRPVWMSGRYNHKKRIAICYNLIEGMSYFFEDESAEVISKLLSVPRNQSISIKDISTQTHISEEELRPFLQELEEVKLCLSSEITTKLIDKYREQVRTERQWQTNNIIKTTKEKLPITVSSSEMDYMNKAGGITSVMFELTYNCSEKCIHCYNIGATRNNEEISNRNKIDSLKLNDYYRIIDELYEQGLVRVCLSGGDPFSNPCAWDIIEYLYKKDIVFDIFTNGQRISHDVKRLANYYPRTVGISIYSGIATIHDYITQIKGSWDKSMNVIEQLSTLAVPMNLKCCIMRPNVKSYYTVYDIAKRYGAIAQFEVNVTDSVDGDKCVSKYLRLTPKQLEIVLRDDNIPLYVGKEAPNYGGQPRNIKENACGAGYNSFCITPDGEFIPCCSFHMTFGNLKNESIKNIIENSDRLKWWKSLSLQQYEECGKHEYCDYCNLCAGLNFSEHKTPLKAGENNCYMAKIRFELAHKMMNGYDSLQGKSVKENLNKLPVYDHVKLKREY